MDGQDGGKEKPCYVRPGNVAIFKKKKGDNARSRSAL